MVQRGRFDPTEYARKRQANVERARRIRESRQDGTIDLADHEYTFSPKIKAETRSGGGVNDNNDELDKLSQQHHSIHAPREEGHVAYSTPVEPEHDELSNEMHRRTGAHLKKETKPIRRPVAGECLRDSSCTCPRCGGDGVDPQQTTSRVRQEQPPRATSAEGYSRANHEDRPLDLNSLSLLKSKIKRGRRRKSRSAPSTSNTLFQSQEPPKANAASYSNSPVVSRKEDNSASPFPGVPLEDEYAEDTASCKCEICGRTFNENSFAKHQRICEKVFKSKRKKFNMSGARTKGTGIEELQNEKKRNAPRHQQKGRSRRGGAEEQPIKVKKEASWKARSSAFRDAIKAGRAVQSGGPLPEYKPSAPDPSLIQCPSCSRRFNEKAAERHIPKCADMMARDNARKQNFKKAASKTAPQPSSRRPRRPKK